MDNTENNNNTNDEAYTAKWQDRIRLLMNKAEDPATPEAERATINERVVFLMAKYGIEEAILNAQQGRAEKVISRGYDVTGAHSKQFVQIIHQISLAFGCRAVFMNNEKQRVMVYGHESDQDRVFMLYASVFVQLMNGKASNYEKKPPRLHGRTWNDSFVKGFVAAICPRIANAYIRAKADVKSTSSGNGMELVLLDRDQAVKNLFRAEHPHTHNLVINNRATNEASYGAGKTAGNQADIGGKRVGGYVRNQLGS